METTIYKIPSAVIQLEWAIKLFLDEEAYIPAITLAGAAEDILRNCIHSDHVAYKKIKEEMINEGVTPEDAHSALIGPRNWLKHWDQKTQRGRTKDDVDAEINLRGQALNAILKAATNLLAVKPVFYSKEVYRLNKQLHETGELTK